MTLKHLDVRPADVVFLTQNSRLSANSRQRRHLTASSRAIRAAHPSPGRPHGHMVSVRTCQQLLPHFVPDARRPAAAGPSLHSGSRDPNLQTELKNQSLTNVHPVRCGGRRCASCRSFLRGEHRGMCPPRAERRGVSATSRMLSVHYQFTSDSVWKGMFLNITIINNCQLFSLFHIRCHGYYRRACEMKLLNFLTTPQGQIK